MYWKERGVEKLQFVCCTTGRYWIFSNGLSSENLEAIPLNFFASATQVNLSEKVCTSKKLLWQDEKLGTFPQSSQVLLTDHKKIRKSIIIFLINFCQPVDGWYRKAYDIMFQQNLQNLFSFQKTIFRTT